MDPPAENEIRAVCSLNSTGRRRELVALGGDKGAELSRNHNDSTFSRGPPAPSNGVCQIFMFILLSVKACFTKNYKKKQIAVHKKCFGAAWQTLIHDEIYKIRQLWLTCNEM